MGPIAYQANLDSDAGLSWHPAHRAGRSFGFLPVFLPVFLLFFGLAAQASFQQAPSSSPISPSSSIPSSHSILIAAEVPDAPQPQIQASPASTPPDQPKLTSASIHGVVVDRDGAVYQGVHVALVQTAPSAMPPRTVTSDSDGRFRFDDVPSGTFQLNLSSQGFATQVVSVLLHPGESYEAPAIVLPFAIATTEVQVTASQHEIAQAQLKDEEKQRVFGVLPNFYTVYAPNAPPLTPKQKFHLAWRSSIDPVTFLATGFFAGIEQADNQFAGYGQGAQGYAKRYAANYADNFIGSMLGSAVLPSLLKQDPRYFYKGTGSTRSRIFYAIANSVICKGDNGHWQVNYSGFIGGAAAGGISNLYYPAADRNGATLTIENTLFGIAGSAAQNLFQEFLVRRLTPRIPNYGSSKP